MQPSQPSPTSQGMLLGIANTLVVALGIAVMERDAGLQGAILVFMIGLVPGLFTGAIVGWIAGQLAASRVWVRRAWLIVPSVVVVAALGETFQMWGFVVFACIPTITGALILERNTRRVVPPPVPVAQARRT